MKKSLFLLAIGAATLTVAHAAVGDTLNLIVNNDYSMNGFIADGVKGTNGYFYGGEFTSDIKNTTRFYDSTKGWAKGNDFSDSQMCWAHTASNLIQYWQSYYGVFYKGNYGELPYGSDYTRTLQSPMAGGSSTVIDDPMRLNVAHKILNYYQSNSAGNVYDATNYYFTWTGDSGGYFSEYFGAVGVGQSNYEGQTAIVSQITTLSSFTDALLPALGISKEGNTYTQTEAGLIAHLNISDGTNSHTLTCYGMTLDADGKIKTVVYADSDDNKLNTIYADGRVPVLSTAYVVEENGSVYLYKKDTYSGEMVKIYGDGDYYVGAVTHINTPDVLKQMLAEYSDVENEAQVWNGGSSVWSIQEASTEELPTAATGWDVHVNGESITAQGHDGYYHTYSVDGRDVVFGNHAIADKRNVSIVGTVSAGHIDIAASGYTFTKGSDDAAIKAGADMTVRSGASLHSELEIQLNNLTLEAGSTLQILDRIEVTGNFVTGAAETSAYTTRATVAPEVNILSALDLREADSITLQATVNMNGNELYLSEGAKFYISRKNEGDEIAAFTNIGRLYLGDSMTESYIINAEIYYAGSETPLEYLLVYNQQLGSLSFVNSIPEPTTTTLSLLALTALVGRRRRR